MNKIKSASILLALVIASGCKSSSDYDNKQPLNQAPSATSSAIATVTDTPITESLLASDPDGDSLSFQLETEPSFGQVSLMENGVYTYSPNAEFTGEDSFSFSASDGSLSSNTATISIEVAIKQEFISEYTRHAFSKSPTDMAEGVNGRDFSDDVSTTDAFQDLVDNGSQ